VGCERGATSLAVTPGASTKAGALRIGTAGFSYPDWVGPVYPSARPGGRSPLERLARWVDLLEVNVSHYRIPAPGTAESWRRATADRPEFRFTAKLWRGYTHGPDLPTRADHRAMLDFLSALGADGRLCAVLAQFPPSFRASARTEAYVHRLAAHFEGHRVAVEFRDASWGTDAIRAGLADHGLAWVVADLPSGPRSLAAEDHVVGGIAYVRLHGRSDVWYRPGVGRDARYDYLYSPEEMRAWSDRIRALRERAALTVVVANNHFSGKAVANALELKSLLEGRPVPGPASLLEAFPRLASFVVPDR
jgi:uncharacterized protein YecE (DUF72 family)